ncbi:hypothetical protein QTP88_028910 [Uroleucon formosanum]
MCESDNESENNSSAHISVFEQRAYIKIETIRGKTVPEIHAALNEVCGTDTVDRSTVQRWHQRFRDGRTSIDNNPRSGRPSTVTQDNTNAAILATLLDEDRRITVREIEQETGISKSSVHRILTEILQKRKIAARWVPHFLSPEQKDTRKDICRELLSRYENEKETFLDRIIAIDETWIRDFEPELKSQSNIWKGITSPRAKKVRRQQTKVKQMMIFAYDKLGIIVTDRVPIGSSVTGDYYKTFLAKKLRPEIRKKRPGMLQNGVSILHDNARPHIGAPVVALLEKYGWERLKHPPYSPDLSPPDFDLFPKLKEPLRGIRFPNLDILNEEMDYKLKDQDILYELFNITDDMAIDSDIGGDSDADDITPISRQITSSGMNDSISDQDKPSSSGCNSRTKRSLFKVVETASDVLNEWDSDSESNADDTDKDKDYEPCPVSNEININFSDDNADDSYTDFNERNILNVGSTCNYVNNELRKDSNTKKFNFTKIGKQPEHFSKSTFQMKSPISNNIFQSTPINIWEKIFSPLIDLIVRESNLYAEQSNNLLDTTSEEMKAFIGILIIMGFHSLPSIRHYWSNDKNFFCDRVASIMTVKRFLKLVRFLHINDNSKMPPPSLEFPSRHLSIDESMVAFKGRSGMKQYMPMKPIKRGFKVWALADSASGYLINFEIYTGKNSNNLTEFGLGENVVLNLSQYLEMKFHCIYFDNFFTSLPLAEKLLNNDIFSCGTFRINKKYYPKDLMKKDSLYKPGDIEFAQCDDISICRWKDRGSKPVTVISSMHDASHTEIVHRKNSRGEKIAISCPSSIADYNRYMGGVDKFDQYMAAYSICQKSRRWWVKLFYYLLDTSIVNSFLMYKKSCNRHKRKYMSHLEFRSTLANELISNYSSRKRPTISPSQKRSKSNVEVISTYESHIATKIATYRRCFRCSTKKHDKRSNIMCATCNKVLCKDCFAEYHKT